MKRALLTTGLALTLGAATYAESLDDTYQSMALYGIGQSQGTLSKYDFSTNQLSTIGTVRNSNGVAFSGIEASAYIPGFQNIIAFWTDPADQLTKMVYVDVNTATGTVVGTDLGKGKVMGATSAEVTDPANAANKSWKVFGVHQVSHLVNQNKPVAGTMNINPNNSPHSEFTLTKQNGSEFSRDDLHKNTNTDTDGVFYDGEAVKIVIKPKGDGSQNTLTVNGQPFPIENNTTYVFTGAMTAKVYNDKLNNGKAMGHWHVELGGQIIVPEWTIENRLIQVDHKTGGVKHLMTLNHEYHSLATKDGNMFYAVNGTQLYAINASAKTESLVGAAPKSQVMAMEFSGTSLMGFDHGVDVIQPMSTTDATSLGAAASMGMADLGTMVFMPLDNHPDKRFPVFD